ncbi:FG-GAP repeat protein, partial [Candidatus Poribacteria bacterium]
MKTIKIFLISLVLGILCLGSVAYGDAEYKVCAPDADGNDEFGYSICISGDRAIVGSWGDDSNRGSAYIYKHIGNDWVLEKKIVADDGTYNDQFGVSVFIDGDYAIVGAYRNWNHRGSAYIFHRSEGGVNNWGQQAHLWSSDPDDQIDFGISVSINGSSGYAVVGARRGENNKGLVDVFYRNEGGPSAWGLKTTLRPPYADTYTGFGHSVSISDEYVAVGAHGKQAVYTYYRGQGGPDNWGLQAELTPSDITSSFGYSVFIDGDDLIVGAYKDSTIEAEAGAVYFFERPGGGWYDIKETSKVTASDAEAYDEFGCFVSISGDYAIIGSHYDDDGEKSGSAYVFHRSGALWNQEAKITSGDASTDDQFGNSVCVSGEYVVVGAPGDYGNVSKNHAGSAYVYPIGSLNHPPVVSGIPDVNFLEDESDSSIDLD